MLYTFETPTRVAIIRRTTRLDYAKGLDFLIDALDRTRGAYFSSGVEYPDRYTRWDFGFTDPPLEFVANERRVTVRALNPRGEALLAILRPALAAAPATTVISENDRALVLEVMPAAGRFAEEERSHQPSALTPLRRLMAEFAGIEDAFLGFYGAFGYDLIFQFEPMELRLPRGEARRDFHLYLPDRIYVLDRRLEAAFCHDFTFARGEVTTKGASHRPFEAIASTNGAAVGAVGVTADQSAEDYAAKVERARERMVAGDVFEVVLSREFRAPYPKPPSALFTSFRETNPSPYEFLIQLGDEAIVGASPEMFVRVEGNRVESCPIAGTVRRSGDPMEDADRVRELLNSAKDEAELTMCTDVDRNDKARICEPGSVRLIGRRLIERYAGLFHTVDHVEGRLRPGFDGIDAFLSHMWAVTLTGAPKRKAVGIIEALETQPRRWYGAAVGGIGFAGGVNTGIAIRTAILKDGVAFYRAGASLVYDSVGADEARETEVKATAFFRALGLSKPAATPAAVTTAQPGRARPRVVMIDHEDSFVHVLADYLRQTGAEVATYRWSLPVEEIAATRPDLVVLSPGPGRPEDFGLPALVRALAAENIPQFGVCLGLQGIAEAFGGALALLDEPRHGKTWQVEHDGTGLFEGLPAPLEVGAYHSIHAPAGDLPPELEITGRTAAGIVMALRHTTLPIAAVQFHPESIMTMRGQAGLRLVGNAVRLLAGQGRKQSARAAAPAA
jgi:anthranilate synthase